MKDTNIYHGTASNPNPYEQDATPEQIAARQEKIDALVDHLMSGKCKPSDLLQEECYDLVDQIVVMLADAFKEGEMQRVGSNVSCVMSEYCERSATWLVDSPETTATIAIKKKLGIANE
jgi:hypothetical protein